MNRVALPSLKTRLRDHQLTIGSWLSFGFPPVAELMARAGFEWLVVDTEHTAIGQAEAHALIQVIELSRCVPLVRVAANEAVAIKHAMDAGAHGVVVPQVNSIEDADRAADALYYPPRGKRGAGLARAQGYGLSFSEYRDWADRESVLVAQIEHIRGVEALEDIVRHEAVDAFIIGPYDLSASIGVPGDWEHKDVVAALTEVERVIGLGVKAAGFHVVHSNRDEFTRRVAAGYRFIAYGDDMVFLAEKVRDEMMFVREQVRGR